MRGSSGGVISRSWVGPFKPMTCREMLGFSHPACGAQRVRDVRDERATCRHTTVGLADASLSSAHDGAARGPTSSRLWSGVKGI